MRWRDGPANRWDWIGVYRAGADDPEKDDYLVWGYTGGHDAGALPPSTEGELVLGRDHQGRPWPLPPGRYVAHYLLTDQYTSVGIGRLHRPLRAARAMASAPTAWDPHRMEAALHLPQIDFTGEGFSGRQVDDVARAAVEHGFVAVSANDHFVFSRPWLDGLGLLARVSPLVGHLDLVTSVVLAPVRGPAVVAAAAGTLAALSEGHVVVGIAAGSSPADYAAVGVPFEERWKRLDESVRIVRALLEGTGPEQVTTRLLTMPEEWSGPVLPPGLRPSLWLGSWGSEAGLRRVARLADGWLASAYNIDRGTVRRGQDGPRGGACPAWNGPVQMPNALATMWTYVTEDLAEADRVLTEVLAPTVRRDPDQLRGRALRRHLPRRAPSCSRATPPRAASGCTSGRWPTSCGRSSGSRRTCCRSWRWDGDRLLLGAR